MGRWFCLFHLFSVFLSPFESRLHESHRLVELMGDVADQGGGCVVDGGSGWCHGGGLVGSDGKVFGCVVKLEREKKIYCEDILF